ncbi:hypothetical protein D9X91_14980 [Falsibacillus albus]|uniref:Uncharacterized protein n=1 Tax=Falsibacillus albus TaxID=2478915 RepID=A0A3L7JU95_9BACI|nr:hypothetical protein D9X91_14980 [Falsibacillus albus]
MLNEIFESILLISGIILFAIGPKRKYGLMIYFGVLCFVVFGHYYLHDIIAGLFEGFEKMD